MNLPFVKIIPLMNKQFNSIIETSNTSEKKMIHYLLELKELQDYSYYIFTSSYDE